MLNEEEANMDVFPAGQPDDGNADPAGEDQIDPVEAERERLKAKVNSYLDAVFQQQRVETIAPAGKALWAATFNLQPAPLRGTRQKMTGDMISLTWLFEQTSQIELKDMGVKMVSLLMTSTEQQKGLYVRHLEKVEEEGKIQMKTGEEKEEKAGGLKPLPNANRYKISSNKLMIGGNAPWHVLQLMQGCDPTEHARAMVSQLIRGFTAQKNGSNRRLTHNEFVRAVESAELDIEGKTLPEKYGLESAKIFLCEDEAKEILTHQKLSGLFTAFLPWQGTGERDQNKLTYDTTWAESKEVAQQMREAAKDLNIARLIRDRDDISVTVRRAVMMLDLLHSFGEDMRAAMYRLTRTLCEIVHWDISWSYPEAVTLCEAIWKELSFSWKEIMGRSTLMESQQQATAAEIVDDVIAEIKARNQPGAFNTESLGYQIFVKGVKDQLKADGIATNSKRKDSEKAPERPTKKEKRDHPTDTTRPICAHFCSTKGCRIQRCRFEHPEAATKGPSDEAFRDDRRWKDVIEQLRSDRFKALVPVEWIRSKTYQSN